MTEFVASEARYRTVPEAAIVELLFVNHWAYSVRDGSRSAAEREVREALDRWVNLGLPHGHSLAGERLFDPVEVVNFVSWAGEHHNDPVEAQYIADSRRMVSELHLVPADAPGAPAVVELGPRPFVVRLSRTFNLQAMAIGERARLRIPAPIEDEALRDLRLEPFASAALDVEYFMAPGQLDARITVPPDRRAVIGYEAAFTGYPGVPSGASGPLEESERELYTRPNEGVIRVSPRIRELASDIAGDERDEWRVVGRFWRHLAHRMRCGEVHYDQAGRSAPLDWVLETGWIDCQLGSALIVALCRARGIPARLVSGRLLYSEAPTQHYWLEVWTPDLGWSSVDRLSWNMAEAGVDDDWRDLFLGAVDYRLKTERLPKIFNAGGGGRLPASWTRLYRQNDGGVETSFHDNDTGALIYKDNFACRRLDPPASMGPPRRG